MTKKTGRPMGRPPIKPSINDPSAVERLCAYISSGMSIKRATDHPDVPSIAVVWARAAKDPEFAAMIARAREGQASALIDDIVEMADNATAKDWQIVRLQIWARQWYASKVAARTFGDKLQHANAAGDGNTEIIYRWEGSKPDDE